MCNEIIVNENITLELIYFDKNNCKLLDIYCLNRFNKTISFICRLKCSELSYDINFEYNDDYFIIYKYRPIVGTGKNEVIDVIKFYEYKNNINRIDTYQKLIWRFNSSGGNLVVNPENAQKKYYNRNMINQDIKNIIMNVASLIVLNKNINGLLINNTLDNNSNKIKSKSYSTNPNIKII